MSTSISRKRMIDLKSGCMKFVISFSYTDHLLPWARPTMLQSFHDIRTGCATVAPCFPLSQYYQYCAIDILHNNFFFCPCIHVCTLFELRSQYMINRNGHYNVTLFSFAMYRWGGFGDPKKTRWQWRFLWLQKKRARKKVIQFTLSPTVLYKVVIIL